MLRLLSFRNSACVGLIRKARRSDQANFGMGSVIEYMRSFVLVVESHSRLGTCQLGVGGDQALGFDLPVVILSHGPLAVPTHRGSFRRMAEQPQQRFS